MPNTLAHIGVQPLLSRPLFPTVEARWLLLGCALPDVPWILQRLAILAGLADAGYLLRSWFTVQASLSFCLLLCAALALASRRPAAVFLALAWGSLLHLLLDALQVKWGGGPVLLAPASWRPLGFDLFWPESWPTAVMTVAGVAAALWLLRDAPAGLAGGLGAGRGLPPWRLPAAALLAAAWLSAPALFLDRAVAGGSHGLDILRPGSERAGRPIAFDRALWDAASGTLRIYTGESLQLVGAGLPDRPARVSVQGVFRDDHTVQVTAIHVHPGGWRDGSSYIGLILVGWSWRRSLGSRRRAA